MLAGGPLRAGRGEAKGGDVTVFVREDMEADFLFLCGLVWPNIERCCSPFMTLILHVDMGLSFLDFLEMCHEVVMIFGGFNYGRKDA